MPTSPVLAHTGLGVIAAFTMLGVMATVLTLVASALILWRYRRAVTQLMASQARDASVAAAAIVPVRELPPASQGAVSTATVVWHGFTQMNPPWIYQGKIRANPR